MTVNLLENVLLISTRGSTLKALAAFFGLVRLARTSGKCALPDRTSSMTLPTRSARRRSSSSVSNSRLMRMVSSARPSPVVKICASTMLAPAAAQAPVMIDRRRGWSGASTVISVTASKVCGFAMVASARSLRSASRMKWACRT